MFATTPLFIFLFVITFSSPLIESVYSTDELTEMGICLSYPNEHTVHLDS
jgi:hypothetical protein